MLPEDAVESEQLHWLKDGLVAEVEQDEKMRGRRLKDGRDALDEE